MAQIINQNRCIIVIQELLHCHVLVITCIADQLHVISGKPLLFSQFYGKTDLILIAGDSQKDHVTEV